MENKKFFKNVKMGVALTGAGLSLMQAQVSNIVSANRFVEIFLNLAAKALENPVNLASATFYDAFLRMAYTLRGAIVRALNIKHADHYDSFDDFKRNCVDKDFSDAAFRFSCNLDLKKLEFEYLLNDPDVGNEDKKSLVEIIETTKAIQEKLKVLMYEEKEYDEGLYNKILDSVLDRASICTDWDTILIDVFCKEHNFNNDEGECEEFFSIYKDKNNKYFKMGDDLYKKAIEYSKEELWGIKSLNKSAALSKFLKFKNSLKDNRSSTVNNEFGGCFFEIDDNENNGVDVD